MLSGWAQSFSPFPSALFKEEGNETIRKTAVPEINASFFSILCVIVLNMVRTFFVNGAALRWVACLAGGVLRAREALVHEGWEFLCFS